MKTIEDKAEEYISGYGDGYAPEGIDISQDPWVEERGFTLEEGKQIFIDGAKWALKNRWLKIERDEDDIASEECLYNIFENHIILFHDSRDNRILIADDNLDDWYKDIEMNPYYDYWMPIPEINK